MHSIPVSTSPTGGKVLGSTFGLGPNIAQGQGRSFVSSRTVPEAVHSGLRSGAAQISEVSFLNSELRGGGVGRGKAQRAL